CATFFAYW
nr:immunoglobulin heavy chain junction region [Mus musculus]MBK4197958.1 immunoglobulin heavy chain junction region [Mus musculus]MBK4197959.1 immunoglobulin heavy chain junction region [Mus musculus]